MDMLYAEIRRLTALCAMASVSEMLLPEGSARKWTRAVAGLLAAEVMLRLALEAAALLSP